MFSFVRSVRGAALCTFLAVSVVYAAGTPEYEIPNRPIRLLVPSPPGGPSDFAGRLVASGLADALGRNIVVDARQSVNGILSMEAAAKATPDGTTLAIGNSGTHVVNVGLYKKLPYDPIRDFAPISLLISAGTALAANPRIAPNTMAEFIAAAKKDPGKFNIGIAGGAGQVMTDVMKYSLGIALNNVPYKGSSPTEIALMSGEVEVALLSIPVVTRYLKAGKIKVLAVTTANRSTQLPDVPTIAESGAEGFDFGNWHALFAPAAVPPSLVQRLYREVVRIFERQEIRDMVVARGNDVIVSSPQELAAKLARDIPKYKRVMAESGIKPQ